MSLSVCSSHKQIAPTEWHVLSVTLATQRPTDRFSLSFLCQQTKKSRINIEPKNRTFLLCTKTKTHQWKWMNQTIFYNDIHLHCQPKLTDWPFQKLHFSALSSQTHIHLRLAFDIYASFFSFILSIFGIAYVRRFFRYGVSIRISTQIKITFDCYLISFEES